MVISRTVVIRLLAGFAILGAAVTAMIVIQRGREGPPAAEAEAPKHTLKHVPVQRGGAKEY